MKSNNFMKKITGAIFAFSLLIGIGVAASVTANAQYQTDQYRRAQDRDYRDQQRNDRNGRGRNDGYGNYGGSSQLRQTALNAGYNEGSKAGRDDRNHNKRYDYNDSGTYQKATKDYSSRLGDKQTYQRYFREAFATGYKDGYRGRA
jgi:hypothetical protein